VPEARLAEVRAFREAYDETDLGVGSGNGRLVTDYILDRFGIVGTPADAIARFEALAEQGVRTFVIAQPFAQAQRDTVLETVAREVIPRIGD
jgi:alkanesulfonate monooxygenase SsuD/methylene tetrahydromethanopterin reductase-like flavin-dependent oxidoreductase (luciferase family)